MDTSPDEVDIKQPLNTLKIPDNITQFGKPGYYPLAFLNDLCCNYCVYCGDLCCPCDEYFNENGKRIYTYSSNDEPYTKRCKYSE
jgi:hypothetical protein